MKKAFFNDQYQQTTAVIEGRKTMARQIRKRRKNSDNGKIDSNRWLNGR